MKYQAALKLREACVAAGLTLFLSVTAASQDSTALFVDVSGGNASVTANDAPVREVLEEIAMQSGIIVYSRSTLDTNVNLSIDEEPIPELIRRILKRHNFTLYYVSDARTGTPVFGSRLWIFADDASSATPLWSVGQPARDWTLRYAAGDPEKNRLRAISSIATREDTSSVAPELLLAMNDPSIAVREEAIYGLSESDDAAAVEYLKNALHDPDSRARDAAISAIAVHAERGNDEATILLAGLLQDEDASIRADVIHALADIDSNVADQYLQQALADSDEINRKTAAGYLAEAAGTNSLD